MQKQITLLEIRQLVIAASGGIIDKETFSDSDKLIELGYNSISMLNLAELLENSYGIFFEPEKDIRSLSSVDNIHKFLIEQLS